MIVWCILVLAWHSGNGVSCINKVTLHWARFVVGWVTVSGFDSRRRHFISVCNQPPRSTQPSTLCGTVKWVPAKGRWCSAAGKSRQAWCSLQVKLCDACLSTLCVIIRTWHYITPCIYLLYSAVLRGSVLAVLMCFIAFCLWSHWDSHSSSVQESHANVF